MRRAVLAFLMTLATATAAFAADPTGKWVGNVETPNGALELTYDFKVEGQTLTGTVSSPMGSLPLNKGKVAGDVFTYEVTIEATTITHEGKLNAAGDAITIKATGDWGTSEYVVKKAPAAK
jgi:hypothetical protein